MAPALDRSAPSRRDLAALNRLTAAAALAGVAFTPALAASTYTAVNLQAQANQRLADDIREGAKDNHLGNVPQGELKVGEVTFQVGEKMLYLRGKVVMDKPERIADVKVDAVCDRIHTLHGTIFGDAENYKVEPGTPIGAYVLHYTDGTTERLAIVYGEDVRDWWEHPDFPQPKNAKVAWTGTNPYADQFERKIRLYARAWDNPKPEKKIATFSFETANTTCSPFLVGLALEKK